MSVRDIDNISPEKNCRNCGHLTMHDDQGKLRHVKDYGFDVWPRKQCYCGCTNPQVKEAS